MMALVVRAIAVGAAMALLCAQAPAPAPPTQVDAPPLDQYCATHACRGEPRLIKLRADGGRNFELTTATYPYVDDDGSIVIYPGETFAVAFPDPADLSKAQYLRVTEPVDPATVAPGTLMVHFEQLDGQTGMMLTLRNATTMPLQFDATMHVPWPDGVVHQSRTSMCTLMPGMTNTEGWPHPVAMLVLSHLRKAELPGNGTPGTVTMNCS